MSATAQGADEKVASQGPPVGPGQAGSPSASFRHSGPASGRGRPAGWVGRGRVRAGVVPAGTFAPDATTEGSRQGAGRSRAKRPREATGPERNPRQTAAVRRMVLSDR